MKGKIITLSIAASLLAIAGSAITLSYFTDAKEAKNTFSVGEVKGELYESHSYTASAGNESAIITEDESYETWLSENCMLVPGVSCAKNPFAKNTGTVPAYVEIDVYYPYELYAYSINANGGIDVLDRGFNCASPSRCEGEWKAKGYRKVVDGKEYFVESFRRIAPLQKGEMTKYAVIKQFGLKAAATQEQIESAKANGSINEDGSIDIVVKATFVQEAGFTDVDDAFETVYPDLTWK